MPERPQTGDNAPRRWRVRGGMENALGGELEREDRKLEELRQELEQQKKPKVSGAKKE
jgi:hypothetical protein